MSGAEFRSILEACAHGDDTDAARALSLSRAMIQKMKAGTAPVSPATADKVRALQDAYADARDAALTAAPAKIEVWRGGQADNDTSWDATGRPARWHRMIAAECHQEHGTRIVYIDEPPPVHDPMELLEQGT